MKLDGLGHILIKFDRPQVTPIDRIGSDQVPRRVVRLTGRYRARDDLILISWDDGSKLNYRWRLHNGDLLLTDNTGQVSQLRRLAD